MPGFGSRLRRSRENLGYTLEQAGEELNIKSADLKALEEEDFSILPDKQFAGTVLGLYSDFLGMDTAKVKEELNKEWCNDGVIKEFIKKTFVPGSSPSGSGSKKRGPVIIGGLIVVALLAVVLYPVFKTDPAPQKETKVSQKNEVPKEKKLPKKENKDTSSAGSEKEASKPGKAVPEENAVPEKPDAEVKNVSPVQRQPIELAITTPRGDCWMEVTVDGKRAFFDLVPKGSKPLNFQGEKEISVLFGNAGAADVTCNGKDLGKAGSMGSVIKRVFPPEK